jgi:hypothetical protein
MRRKRITWKMNHRNELSIVFSTLLVRCTRGPSRHEGSRFERLIYCHLTHNSRVCPKFASAGMDSKGARLDDENDIQASAASDIRSDNLSDDDLSYPLYSPVGPTPCDSLDIRNVQSQMPISLPSNSSLDIHSLLSEEEFPESSDSATDSELQSIFSYDREGPISIAEPALSSYGNRDPFAINQWLQDILPGVSPQDPPMYMLGDISAPPHSNKSDRVDLSTELQNAYFGQTDALCGDDPLVDVDQTELSDLSFDHGCDVSLQSFGSRARASEIPMADNDLDVDLNFDVDDEVSQSAASLMSCVSQL